MKEYFTRLFEYDRHANLIMLQAVSKASIPGKSVKVIAHILAAQQVWLKRCQYLPAITEYCGLMGLQITSPA